MVGTYHSIFGCDVGYTLDNHRLIIGLTLKDTDRQLIDRSMARGV